MNNTIIVKTKISQDKFVDLIKWTLIYITLALIIFEKSLYNFFPNLLLRTPEKIFIVVLLFLFIVRLKTIKYNAFLVPYILLLSISLSLSILGERSSLLQSIAGAVDISRKFIIYFCISSFLYKVTTFRRIFLFVEKILLFFGVITVIQFVIVILFPKARELFFFDGELMRQKYRFGIPKLSSIWAWSNIGAPLYLLLFFIYHNSRDKNNVKFKKLLCIMLFLIFQSRAVIISFFTYLLISRKYGLKLKLIVASILIFFFIKYVPELSHFHIINPQDTRIISVKYGLQIWNSNKIFGLGPGTFGGNVSFMFTSKIYDKLPIDVKELFYAIHTTDIYWIQILVEIGILGLLIYLYTNYKIGQIFIKKSKEYSTAGLMREYSIMKGIGDYIKYAIPVLGIMINLNYFTVWTLAIILGSIGLKCKWEPKVLNEKINDYPSN